MICCFRFSLSHGVDWLAGYRYSFQPPNVQFRHMRFPVIDFCVAVLSSSLKMCAPAERPLSTNPFQNLMGNFLFLFSANSQDEYVHNE